MLNPNQLFGNNDDQVNGDILVNKSSRVVYEVNRAFEVLIPVDYPVATVQGDFEPLGVTRAETAAFLVLNVASLRDAIPTMNADDCAIIAYYRFLAVKYRLMSPVYKASDHYVDYNQCLQMRENAFTVDGILADEDAIITKVNKRESSAAIMRILTLERRREIQTIFNNVVCLLALMFRTRGHHYFPDMLTKITRLWNKTVTGNIPPGISFQHLFTTALHAIIPIVLDNYWTHCVTHAKCDDILRLRHSAPAAGTAAFTAILNGMEDILAVMPQIEARIGPSVEYVRKVCNILETRRWDHAINAKFYNANPERLDEKHVGVVASLIKSTLDAVAIESPLIESLALRRCANTAPISGAMFSTAVKNLLRSDKFLALPST